MNHVPAISVLMYLSAVWSLQKVVALKTWCPRTVITSASTADRYGILRSILTALSSSFSLALIYGAPNAPKRCNMRSVRTRTLNNLESNTESNARLVVRISESKRSNAESNTESNGSNSESASTWWRHHIMPRLLISMHALYSTIAPFPGFTKEATVNP